MTCRACNNNKNDHLAAKPHHEKWYIQNIIKYSKEIECELSQYFNSNQQRTVAITSWAYETAKNNNNKFWAEIGTYTDYIGVREATR